MSGYDRYLYVHQPAKRLRTETVKWTSILLAKKAGEPIRLVLSSKCSSSQWNVNTPNKQHAELLESMYAYFV